MPMHQVRYFRYASKLMAHEAASLQRVLVTGGAGFIGSHLVELLVRQRVATRVLELPEANTQHLPAEAEILRADICDTLSLADACDGCDTVFHLAAYARLWAPDPRLYHQCNVHGTHNMLQAAQRCGVQRFIHTSTELVLQQGSAQVINEALQPPLADMVGPYCRSKWAAEQLVQAADAPEFHTRIVTPTVPVGSGDRGAGALTQMLRQLARGKIKAQLQGGLVLVDVRDVAEGLYRTALTPTQLPRYLIGAEYWPLSKLLYQCCDWLQQSPPRLTVPRWLGLLFAHLEQASCRLLSRPPLSSVCGIKAASCQARFDCSQTTQVLGLQYRPCLPGLKAMTQAAVNPAPIAP